MSRLLSLTLLLSGCILTEELPEEIHAGAVSASSFQARCEAQGMVHAVGCALLCGGGEPALSVEATILGYVGAGAAFQPHAGDFQVRAGEMTWVTCAPNRFDGLECAPQARAYALHCLPDGVGVGDAEGFSPGQPLIPAEILNASPLSVMAVGAFDGAPGSCLSACVAAATRPGCDQCAPEEGCMETDFGSACHARGLGAAGAPCAGPQSCESLRCGIGGRCE